MKLTITYFSLFLLKIHSVKKTAAAPTYPTISVAKSVIDATPGCNGVSQCPTCKQISPS